jgi:hypothetical protein
MRPPSSLVIHLRDGGLIDLPLRAIFSPAHPLARRDVPLTRARGVRDRRCASTGDQQAPSPSGSASKKGTWPLLECATWFL